MEDFTQVQPENEISTPLMKSTETVASTIRTTLTMTAAAVTSSMTATSQITPSQSATRNSSIEDDTWQILVYTLTTVLGNLFCLHIFFPYLHTPSSIVEIV